MFVVRTFILLFHFSLRGIIAVYTEYWQMWRQVGIHSMLTFSLHYYEISKYC